MLPIAFAVVTSAAWVAWAAPRSAPDCWVGRHFGKALFPEISYFTIILAEGANPGGQADRIVRAGLKTA